ncbi:MAG: hypothetical protein L6408_02125, partial [Nanoarchaeota archaeon]|nr:hypothetical protein [Nanoarchaeota archaeon]
HQEAVKEHRELTTNKHLSRKAWEEENKLNAEQDAERRKQLFTSFLTPKGKEIYNNNRRDSKIEVA